MLRGIKFLLIVVILRKDERRRHRNRWVDLLQGLSWLEGHDGIFIVLRDNPARENHGGYFRNGLLRNPETGWPTDPGQPRPRPAFNWWY